MAQIDLIPEIRERLLSSPYNMKLSGDGKYLREGVCPDCGKKEG